MKKISVFVAMLLVTVFVKGQNGDFEWVKKVKSIKATVKFLEDKETVVIVPDGSESMRYISQQLPEEFKRDGLKITVSGWEGKIPPNVRMLGKPLKIKCVCVSKSEQKKFNLKQRKYIFK